MVHISPWAATLGLMRGRRATAAAGAPLILYGPYRRAGVPTAPSNEAFDAVAEGAQPGMGAARARSGRRRKRSGTACGWSGSFEMPANNLTIVFRGLKPSPVQRERTRWLCTLGWASGRGGAPFRTARTSSKVQAAPNAQPPATSLGQWTWRTSRQRPVTKAMASASATAGRRSRGLVGEQGDGEPDGHRIGRMAAREGQIVDGDLVAQRIGAGAVEARLHRLDQQALGGEDDEQQDGPPPVAAEPAATPAASSDGGEQRDAVAEMGEEARRRDQRRRRRRAASRSGSTRVCGPPSSKAAMPISDEQADRQRENEPRHRRSLPGRGARLSSPCSRRAGSIRSRD